MKNSKQMVNFYFSQDENYMSEHQETLVKIADMHPTYAANAARRLLTDGYTWASDAGQDTKSYARWMLGTPLFRALQARATGTAEAVARYKCQDCSFTTASSPGADQHSLHCQHVVWFAS